MFLELTDLDNIHGLETMSDLTNQVPGVVQGRAKTELVGVELSQPAIVAYEIEWALALAGD